MSRKSPNILFFFTDDQRFDTIRALGNPCVVTPTMDRLVAAGTAFTHAHIPGGTSGAVCMPSRAMLHTGRTLFHLRGARRGHSPGPRADGRASEGTRLSHMGHGQMAQRSLVVHPQFLRWRRDLLRRNGRPLERTCLRLRPGRQIRRHLAPVCGPAALQCVDAAQRGPPEGGKAFQRALRRRCGRVAAALRLRRPFLHLRLVPCGPHDPRTMPREYLDLYDPEDIPLPGNFVAGHSFDNGDLKGARRSARGLPARPGQGAAAHRRVLRHDNPPGRPGWAG